MEKLTLQNALQKFKNDRLETLMQLKVDVVFFNARLAEFGDREKLFESKKTLEERIKGYIELFDKDSDGKIIKNDDNARRQSELDGLRYELAEVDARVKKFEEIEASIKQTQKTISDFELYVKILSEMTQEQMDKLQKEVFDKL